MAISPHDIRARHFATVKRGGYDQREVEAFRTAAAEALEQATQQATAMEARARAAVARLQDLQQQQTASQPAEAAEAPGKLAVGAAEAETISRTLLLAQRTADATVADAEKHATDIVEAAKAESRKAGEAERVRVEGEVQALLARRDFLEADVDQLEQFLGAQRERISAVAAELNDVTSRVGNGLATMRRPQLSASDSDHTPEVATAAAEAVASGPYEEEADVAELIEQVGNSGGEEHAEAPALEDGEERHSLFSADEQR
jgi:DivIVA domain-containing protein